MNLFHIDLSIQVTFISQVKCLVKFHFTNFINTSILQASNHSIKIKFKVCYMYLPNRFDNFIKLNSNFRKYLKRANFLTMFTPSLQIWKMHSRILTYDLLYERRVLIHWAEIPSHSVQYSISIQPHIITHCRTALFVACINLITQSMNTHGRTSSVEQWHHHVTSTWHWQLKWQWSYS